MRLQKGKRWGRCWGDSFSHSRGMKQSRLINSIDRYLLSIIICKRKQHPIYRRKIMQASTKKQARHGITISDTCITSKKRQLYRANGKLVTSTSQYPKSVTLPALCILIGGILIKTDNPIIGGIIAGVGLCMWLFSGKKVEDAPEKIHGPLSSLSPLDRQKSIPKGAIPENGITGWYWKWRTNKKTDPLWSPFFNGSI